MTNPMSDKAREVPSHCSVCGQAKWLSKVFPVVEAERDALKRELETLKNSIGNFKREETLALLAKLSAENTDLMRELEEVKTKKVYPTDYERNFQQVEVPFVREWATYRCDEHGNIPPQEEWIWHKEEYVIVKTSERDALAESLKELKFKYDIECSSKNYKELQESLKEAVGTLDNIADCQTFGDSDEARQAVREIKSKHQHLFESEKQK